MIENIPVNRDILSDVLEALLDTQTEINEPEVNVYISYPLEVKVEDAVAALQGVLRNAE